MAARSVERVVCMGTQQALAFELLNTVLDLMGSVDGGGKLMRVGRGWRMRWIVEVLACLLGFPLSFSFAS